VHESRFVAVVLAAGGSARLGRAKQLLARDGETLLHRTARLACESGAARVCAVLGADAATMRAALRGLALDVIENPAWGQGLSSSLHAALASIDADAGGLLILGCDQPALDGAHLRELLGAAARAPARCAATRYGDAIGMPAFVPIDLARDSIRALRGDRGLRGMLSALPRDALGLLNAPELGFDLDTAQDVERARRLGLVDPDDGPERRP
jgi:molybdenum cofactor cytidylyltransferase